MAFVLLQIHCHLCRFRSLQLTQCNLSRQYPHPTPPLIALFKRQILFQYHSIIIHITFIQEYTNYIRLQRCTGNLSNTGQY